MQVVEMTILRNLTTVERHLILQSDYSSEFREGFSVILDECYKYFWYYDLETCSLVFQRKPEVIYHVEYNYRSTLQFRLIAVIGEGEEYQEIETGYATGQALADNLVVLLGIKG